MHLRWLLFVLALAQAGCAPLGPVEYAGRTPSYALPNAQETPLGAKSARLARHRPADRSGFLLLDRGEEALLWRGMLADRATRTIDAQYFIWSQDNVGTIAAERLLKAAERGVRVRVIVDEVTLDAEPRFLALLNDHPLVEIRVYNPLGSLDRSPGSKIARMIRAVGDFGRFNRRMHNKVFVVDGSVAILGGRNVADEYYDLDARSNFRDLDVVAIGPVVPNISISFDDYWNSPWVVPVKALLPIRIDPSERDAYYRQLHRYAADPHRFPPRFGQSLAAIAERFEALKHSDLYWGRARLIYDRPGKNRDVQRLDAFGESGRRLTELASRARSELIAETPYLILLPGTFDLLEKLRRRGVKVSILTNSLAATDAVWVHSKYAFQRRKLLGMGVKLFEYRPDADDRPRLIARYQLMNRKTSLVIHAKTLVVDRKAVFIGSFNMDPRSTHLNTEIGVIIESAELAAAVARTIERDMASRNSWSLALTPERRIEWTTVRDGRLVERDAEPDVGFGKAIKVLLLAILPIAPLM